jgi:hypothetical protein
MNDFRYLPGRQAYSLAVTQHDDVAQRGIQQPFSGAFFVYCGGKRPARRGVDEPLTRNRRLTQIQQLSRALRVVVDLQQRMAVMSNGDIVVGKNAPARTSASITPENRAKGTEKSAPMQAAHEEHHCGAMSQQRGDGGAVSTPQKFLHLVGCRDPKARPSGGR